MSVRLNTKFEPRHGQLTPISANVARVTANNPGVFTFHGTNTYIVGTRTLGIIDPGPAQPEHLSALVKAIGGRPVSHIFVTHTHRDHSDLVPLLVEATGAKTVAEGRHRPARALYQGEINPLDASSDMAFIPDVQIKDGERIEGDNWIVEAVVTPGHAANHCAYALTGTDMLFSGDHVMAWATTIVAPPDGAMSAYMHSLDKLLQRDDGLYLPGHGGAVSNPRTFVRALKAHRKMRERAILQRMKAGDWTIAQIVASIYRDTDPRLHGAAALSVLAHLEDLCARGRVASDGRVALGSAYHLA